MDQNTGKSIEEMQREIEKLQRALQDREYQLQQFGDGLAEVNTGLVSLIDKNFDGNVYRNAMEHSFKEHVYTKIRNVFGAIALIAGVGGFFFVNASIKTIVEATIDEQQEEFAQASVKLTLERLRFMLKELEEMELEETPEILEARANEIKSEKKLKTHIKSFITEGSKDRQLIALNYAGLARDKELEESVLEVLKDDDHDLEVRIKALNTLLRPGVPDGPRPRSFFDKKAETVGALIDETLTQIDNPDHALWRELTRILSVRAFESSRVAKEAEKLIQKALASRSDEIVRGAVLFYLTNPSLVTKTTFDNLPPDKRGFADVVCVADAKFMAGGCTSTSTGESTPTREQVTATSASSFLTKQLSLAEEDSHAREQLLLMKGYLALAELRRGKKKVMEQMISQELPVFPASAWADVKGLFENFETTEAPATHVDHSLGLPDELRSEQNELWQKVASYKWDEQADTYKEIEVRRYLNPEELKELKNGKRGPLVTLLSSEELYDADEWPQILDLFPDYDLYSREYEQYLEDAGESFGADHKLALQNELLYRISDEDYYEWDQSQRVYVALTPQRASIAALERGEKGPMIEYVLYGNYYDDASWQKVLGQFPRFKEVYDRYERYLRSVDSWDESDGQIWQAAFAETLANYWDGKKYTVPEDDVDEALEMFQSNVEMMQPRLEGVDQKSSIESLKRGDLRPLEDYIASGYYDAASWDQVLELFPAFKKERAGLLEVVKKYAAEEGFTEDLTEDDYEQMLQDYLHELSGEYSWVWNGTTYDFVQEGDRVLEIRLRALIEE